MNSRGFLIALLACSQLVLSGCVEETETEEIDEEEEEIGASDEDEDEDEPEEEKECTGAKPTGCLYDVVVCEDGSWVCGDTPLVLSFTGEAPAFAPAGVDAFDLTGKGVSMVSDWPTAATPWLALDRNADGRISDGTELFGSAVRLADGSRAENGFDALAELDANADGRVDAADPRFAELRIWADADADRMTDQGELRPASTGAVRLISIELAYESRAVCDARNNCGLERARFTWADANGALRTGEVVDVHLPAR
jgi:hypothetical protein